MKKLVLFSLFMGLGFFSNAQNIGGVATYKTAGSIPFKMEGDQMTPEMKKMIEQRMAKAMQKEFTLQFNINESLYEEVVELEKEGQRGMRFMAMFTGGGGIYYRNLKENRFTDQTEFFGKTFLIKDELEKIDWKIGDETKTIGNYICQKASAIRIRDAVKLSGGAREGLKDSAVVDTIHLTAWFTLQIPVSHGPGPYAGLPGLILELNDGNITTLCTKVSLNTQKSTLIEEPDSGEEVSEEEYAEITQKKLEEMQQNFGNRRGGGRGGNRSFEITIGR